VGRRQARVAEVCERHKPSLVWDERRMEKSMRRHLWDVVNHLVYCPIAKVASTTWFSNFLAWSHIKRANVPHVLKQFEEVGSRNGKGKENWEGEAGGKGIRTLARYIYQAPEASDLEELTSQFKENTGFLIVRHPFVRLVSAYEDKMLRCRRRSSQRGEDGRFGSVFLMTSFRVVVCKQCWKPRL